MVPLLIVGTLRKRNGQSNIFEFLLGICIVIFKPIQLQCELAAAQYVKKKLLIVNDVNMASNLNEVLIKIKCLEEEIIRHSRLHLGKA